MIDRGSPAERAGLRPGDLIVEINGRQILTDQEALTQVAALAPGSEIEIRFRRGKQSLTARATLEERPERKMRAETASRERSCSRVSIYPGTRLICAPSCSSFSSIRS